MKPLSATELHVTREGYRLPRVSPAPTAAAAVVGLSGAVRDKTVRAVAVVENRKKRLPSGRVWNVQHQLVTFTREGPQEFANGRRAWWEAHQ